VNFWIFFYNYKNVDFSLELIIFQVYSKKKFTANVISKPKPLNHKSFGWNEITCFVRIENVFKTNLDMNTSNLFIEFFSSLEKSSALLHIVFFLSWRYINWKLFGWISLAASSKRLRSKLIKNNGTHISFGICFCFMVFTFSGCIT
jgi:hypothetical protein